MKEGDLSMVEGVREVEEEEKENGGRVGDSGYWCAGNILCLCLLGGRRGRCRRRPKTKNDVGRRRGRRRRCVYHGWKSSY